MRSRPIKPSKAYRGKRIKVVEVKRGRHINMESTMNKVIVVGVNFDKFVEDHKQESRSALEMHLRRAEIIRKNRIK